ncbi:rifin PIR protein,putative [Plasmodium sp. DRC-Itaito]|nr:rifin PIR protein,putative [Plasmodium sp. DRC-Itaito]
MKVHYINILMFSLPLNILINEQRNHKNIPQHTPKIRTTRLLCECDLYMTNYDNDPQMKSVMENFNRQTSQRFHEYDERLQEKRKQCKDKCDKEIQKIILKDKLEKELIDKFATLQTDIQNDAISTCVCEKSIADKVEKGCLRCGYGLGTVAPTVGLLGSVAVHAWKPVAIDAAIKAALKLYAGKISIAAKAAGAKEGMRVVTESLKEWSVYQLIPEISEKMSTISDYTNVTILDEFIFEKQNLACSLTSTGKDSMCGNVKFYLGISNKDGSPLGAPGKDPVTETLTKLVADAKGAAEAKVAATKASMESTVKTVQEKAIEAASYDWYATIGYSVLAILIIVLVMIIIYLVLRYRRKKKMKKKAEYTKLLKE